MSKKVEITELMFLETFCPVPEIKATVRPECK